MEMAIPAVLPLKLKSYEAPSWIIALFMTTIPAAVSAVVCPIIGYWSDRYRGRLGRRIPFILGTIPFLFLFLTLIGFTPDFATFFVKAGWATNEHFPALLMLGLFATGFQIFNMVVASVYYYLFNDVVPQEMMGRFLTAFRFVGVIASAFFSYFLFPKAESHFTEILIGAAVLYAAVFTVMCLRVKEGQYPDPPPSATKGHGLLASVKTFFIEGYTSRYYWYFYLFVGFWHISTTINVFVIFFARDVGLTLDQLGSLSAIFLIVSAALLLPFGFLIDRYHPLRMIRIACSLLVLIAPLSLVFAFGWVPREWAFTVWVATSIIGAPVTALYTASEMPIYMKILPRDRFGQFSAATALVRSLALMIGGVLSGLFIDGARNLSPYPDYGYRFIPLWSMFFQGVATVFLFLLYKEWKKRGDAQ